MFKNKNLIFLGLGLLSSTIGTFVLLLALTAQILESTSSNILASGVFAVQWVFPFVFAYPLSSLATRYKPRILLVLSEAGGICTSLFIAYLAMREQWMAVLAVLAFRGICDAVAKSSRMTFIKLTFSSAIIRSVNSTVNTIYFVGIAFGSFLGSILIVKLSLPQIALADALSFLLSAACYACLTEEKSSAAIPIASRTSFVNFIRILKDTLTLQTYCLLSATVLLFQAFHQVVRAYLPMQRLGLSKAAVAQLQLSSITGVIIGAVLVTLWTRKKSKILEVGKVWMWAAYILMITTLFIFDWPKLLVVYAIFMVCFEVSFLVFQNRLLHELPEVELKKVTFWVQSTITLWMSLAVFLQSVVLDYFGFSGLIVSLSLVFLAAALFLKERVSKGIQIV